MQPLVSIIINCHNSEEYLKEAIDSCYSQEYQNWEIIFFDNASTDNSKKIAISYNNKLKYFYSKKKLSLGEARNNAIKLSNGKYICFLDCDDVYLSNKVKDQVEFMEKKNIVFSYSDYHIIDEKSKIKRSFKNKLKNGFIINSLLLNYEVNFQSSMFSNSIFKNEKLFFDKTLFYSPDYNLIMKIAANHFVGILNKYTVCYRVHKNANSKKQLELVSKEIRYTLHYLEEMKNKNKNVNIKHSSLEFAYSKLNYYDSIYFISINNYKIASKLLNKVKFKSIKFFILLILIKLNLPSKIILKILRR